MLLQVYSLQQLGATDAQAGILNDRQHRSESAHPRLFGLAAFAMGDLGTTGGLWIHFQLSDHHVSAQNERVENFR